MATILLYSTGKRTTSTLVPEFTAGDSYESNTCEFFEPLDILNPIIILREEALPNLPRPLCKYNYVYIQSPLERYYWITRWTRDGGLWYAACTVDYLASFRSDILNTTQYVIRTSNPNLWDNSIIDYTYTYNLQDYTVKENGMGTPISGVGTWQTLQDFRPSQHPAEHMLVLNVNPSGTTWSFTSTSEGANVSNYAPNILVLRADQYSNVLSAIKNTDQENVQIAQYINNAYWIPIPFTETGQVERYVEKVYFGSFKDAEKDDFLTSGENYQKTWNMLQIGGTWAVQPNHNIDCIWEGTIPDISDVTYENSANYKSVVLRFHPFGEFPLDSNLLAGTSKIRVRVTLNVATGMAELSYRQQTPNIGEWLTLSNTNIAVPIQLNTIVNNNTAWQRQHISNWLSLGTSISSAYGHVMSTQGAMLSSIAGIAGSGGDKMRMLSGAGSMVQVLGNSITQTGNDSANIASAIVNLVAEKPIQMASQVSGAYGTTLMDYNPIIISYRNKVVDRMDERFGRPLYKRYKLSELGGGLCICQNAVFGGTGIGNRATSTEKNAIEMALNGGIYLE